MGIEITSFIALPPTDLKISGPYSSVNIFIDANYVNYIRRWWLLVDGVRIPVLNESYYDAYVILYFDSTKLSNGPHSFVAQAILYVDTPAVTYTVENKAVPTVPLAVITSPTAGETISGKITVKATITSNVQVTKAMLQLAGFGNLDTKSAPVSGDEWEFQFDTKNFPNVSVPLFIMAFNVAGQLGVSQKVTVNIKN